MKTRLPIVAAVLGCAALGTAALAQTEPGFACTANNDPSTCAFRELQPSVEVEQANADARFLLCDPGPERSPVARIFFDDAGLPGAAD